MAIKIDIGCGRAKTAGFVGLDRFALPGVDIVCDFNSGIPLADNSVDYVIASHSLEHIENLPDLMADVARVCCDRAIISIAAPYSATRLNEANPYHVRTFNEHTPRFWTDETAWPLDSSNFDFPGIPIWGIAGSDNGAWKANIRLLKSEYFYFPPYRQFDAEVKAALRRKFTDVCDAFVLHCVVLKSYISETELVELSVNTDFHESYGVPIRRAQEAEHGQSDIIAELVKLPERVRVLEAELEVLKLTLHQLSMDDHRE